MAKLVYTGNRNEILADLNTIAVLLKAAGVKSFDKTQAEALLDTLFTGEEKDLDFFGAIGRMERSVAKCGVEQYRLTVEFDEDGYVEGNKWLRRGIRMFRPLISGIAALVKGAKDTLAIGDKLSTWLDEMHSSNSQPEPDEPESSEPAPVVPDEDAIVPGVTYALATDAGYTILLRKSEDKDEVDIVDCVIPSDKRVGKRWNAFLEKAVAYTNIVPNAWRSTSEAKARRAYAGRVDKVAHAPKFAVITVDYHTALLRLDCDANDHVVVKCTMPDWNAEYDAWLKEIDKVAYSKTGIWKKMSEKNALREYEERVKAVPAPTMETEMKEAFDKFQKGMNDVPERYAECVTRRVAGTQQKRFHAL